MRTYFLVFLTPLFFVAAIHVSAAENMKLPYVAGERFVVTTGYATPPTHIKKDNYAIDFAKNGCEAYGAPAVAAFSGTAWIVREEGYNGGYGTQILLLSSGNVVTRYAHLVSGSIPFRQGDEVSQGAILGEIGNTGLVAGASCAEHPGTHLHFAMDRKDAAGDFIAQKPEPLSGYADIAKGQWYASDNVLAATKDNLAALVSIFQDLFGGRAANIMPAATNFSLPEVSPQPIAGSVPVLPPPVAPSLRIASSAAEPVAAALLLPARSYPAADIPSASSSVSSQNAAVSEIAPSSSVQHAASSGVFLPSGGVSVGTPSTVAVGASVSPSASDSTATGTVSDPDDPSDDAVAACVMDNSSGS